MDEAAAAVDCKLVSLGSAPCRVYRVFHDALSRQSLLRSLNLEKLNIYREFTVKLMNMISKHGHPQQLRQFQK